MSLDIAGPVVAFGVVVLLFGTYVMVASGHFPRAARGTVGGQAVSSVLLWGANLATLVALLVGIAGAWLLIPWYAGVIAGGFAMLAAPIVLQGFPDVFVDGRGALLTFAGGTIVAAMLLAWLAVGHVQ